MLREMQFVEVDKVNVAINRLKIHEAEALRRNPKGYYVAFSGGKDSCVVLDLCRRAGVAYHAHYALTTVDPPELVQFIKQEYPEAWDGRDRPDMSMWQLIVKKRMPPTQLARYCCQYLKEPTGAGNIVLTGIRHAESVARSKRKMEETCTAHKKTGYLHPIIDWSTEEVWEYIHTYHVPYCKLYDEGFTRLGCIGCPFGRAKQQKAQFARWPKYKVLYEQAFARMIEKRRADGLPTKWETADDVMQWWLKENRTSKDCGDQLPLFGLKINEADT